MRILHTVPLVLCALGLQACADGGNTNRGNTSGDCQPVAPGAPVIFSDGFDRSSPAPQWTVTAPSVTIDGGLGCPPPALRLERSNGQPAAARTSTAFDSLGRTFAIDLRLDPGVEGDSATFTVVQSADQPTSSYARVTIEQHRVVVENQTSDGDGNVTGFGESIHGFENHGQVWHASFSIDAQGFGYIVVDDGSKGGGGGSSGYGSAGPMIMKVEGGSAWFDNAVVTEP
jgi:hypothetical protein